MAELSVTYHATPPSLNRVGGRSHWGQWRREKLKWQQIVEARLLEAQLPRELAYVQVSAVLRFPTLHRRDEGNYRTILEKVCGDSLVRGGWLPDDTPAWYRFGAVEFEPVRGANRTVLTFEYRRAGERAA